MCTIFLSLGVIWARQLLNYSFKDDCFRPVEKKDFEYVTVSWNFIIVKPILCLQNIRRDGETGLLLRLDRLLALQNSCCFFVCSQHSWWKSSYKEFLVRCADTKLQNRSNVWWSSGLMFFRFLSRVEEILGSLSSWRPTFCRVAPNICGSSVWHLPHIMLLAYRILRWLIHFCRPGNVVGITTGYGLDGPGIKSL